MEVRASGRALRDAPQDAAAAEAQLLLGAAAAAQVAHAAEETAQYDPVARLRAYDLRLHEARLNASIFVTDLCEGRFNGLNLSTIEPPNTEGRCSVSGHLQAPEFAFDPDVGALMIEDLPKHLSAWEVYESLQDCSGFCTASCNAGPIHRTFHARFRSSREARQAMEALAQVQLLREDGSCAVAQLCGLTPELSAFVLPPEMSLPERLQRDLELSAEVLQRLDALLEVCHEATEYILQYPGSTELKLDLQVLYLRRVHHFCFYAASWCQDEWALRDRCGAAALRSGKRPSSILEESDWTFEHEKRIEKFLASGMSLDASQGQGVKGEGLQDPSECNMVLDQKMSKAKHRHESILNMANKPTINLVLGRFGS
eukprot:s2119_g12.t1